MPSTLTISPLSDSTFGAVVENLDVETVVGPDAPGEVWDELYRAWIEHALLILPAVFLTREQQVALAKGFGSIELLGGHEIVALSNVTSTGALRGEDDMMKVLRGNMDWHVDSTYMPLQSKGAVFSAVIVPTEGGSTGFADMRAAYAALDDDTKSMVEGLSAHHSMHHSQRAHSLFGLSFDSVSRARHFMLVINDLAIDPTTRQSRPTNPIGDVVDHSSEHLGFEPTLKIDGNFATVPAEIVEQLVAARRHRHHHRRLRRYGHRGDLDRQRVKPLVVAAPIHLRAASSSRRDHHGRRHLMSTDVSAREGISHQPTVATVKHRSESGESRCLDGGLCRPEGVGRRR